MEEPTTGASGGSTTTPAPLDGIVVIDASRMLPGAVLARTLLDLGARLLKVEDPGIGDPLRLAPPLVDGVGAGFCALLRGAESLTLDLRSAAGAAALATLCRRADVLVESFRPAFQRRAGIEPETLAAANPTLVICSLPGFGAAPGWEDRPAHDLNAVALAGLLPLLGGSVPQVQLADATAGLLAASAVLAALLRRTRTGRGGRVVQAVAAAPLALAAWQWADAAAGHPGVWSTLLAGEGPSYRLYTCADGRQVAVAALEPKLWAALLRAPGLEHLTGAALATGSAGEPAVAALSAVFATAPRDHWLALATRENLPLTPMHALDEAVREPLFEAAGWVSTVPGPRGTALRAPGPAIPDLASTSAAGAPLLGQHSRAIMDEFGL
jgi:alpha-methylacyl-CoA racemase